MSDNIKVVVKVRPLISREIEDKLSYQWRVKNDTLYQLDQNGKDCGSCFTFDKVYNKDTATTEVYNDVANPIVEAAIAGFNGTIFAYGQTSSGKTYTMSGTDQSPGIIPLAVVNLFHKIKQIPDRDFLVRVSYIEIYNETLKDLLNVEKKNVRIHETIQGVKVDVLEQVTASPEEVLEYMKKGEANRHTGATNMNEESSRSHSIFQITIESREHTEGEEDVGVVNVSQLNLVDLAGSERAGQTGATGLRFKEGTHINKSLSCLALVIKQLSEMGPNNPQKYINYRDSKLTRILQNSLGGNAKTSIICAVTPASVEETISTLQFANRAKAIKNTPEVNAVASDTDSTMIQSLTKKLCKLQAQLMDKRTIEQDNAKLQTKISNLKNVILNGFNKNTETSQKRMQNLRRVTICTLQPIAETDDSFVMPAVPKFRTPSLKYNPLSLSLSEFQPISTSSKSSLGALPEEERMVTPPPAAGKQEEIINLDDSDEAAESKMCSPYHKCYERSKTPPCVLRTKAKVAEKDFKDILELTEREKIYTPDTVELLEKLDQSRKTIAHLEEQVVSLQGQSKEKDSQITELLKQICKTNEEVKAIGDAKKSLENQCKELSAKLTDLEVSYETLQKKSKRREEELLLRIEDEKARKEDNIRKSSSREINLMDLSRDISLVNSDIENSIIHPAEAEPSAQINELVAQLHAQLSAKNDAILQLESNLYAEKQNKESLQSSIVKLKAAIDEFNVKFPQLETENDFLKSTIETLNSTIEKQKVALDNSRKDMESFNNTIQELQIRLSRKDAPYVKINDSALETMIANEEIVIANNENLRNIIYSFKLTINSKNKELDGLKTQMLESLEAKEGQINTLTEQIERLNDQINENIQTISRLMEIEKDLSAKLVMAQDDNDSLLKQIEQNAVEASNLKELNSELSNDIKVLKMKLDEAEIKLKKEKELITDLIESNQKVSTVVNEIETKLADAQEHKDSFEEQIKEYAKEINQLKSTVLKLTMDVEQKEVFIKDINSKYSILAEKYESMLQKVADLEKEISVKHEDVIKLGDVNKQAEENLLKMKLVHTKLQDILSHFQTNVWEASENVDSLETSINLVMESMNILQVAIRQDLEKQNQAMEDVKQKYISLEEKYASEISLANNEIEDIKNIRDESVNLCTRAVSEMSSLKDSLLECQKELQEKKHAIMVLESQLYEANENSENLRKDIHVKDEIIAILKENIASLGSEMKLLALVDDEAKNGLKETNSDLSKAMEEMKVLSSIEEQARNDLKQNISDLNKAMEEREKSFEEMMIIKNEKISELETRLVHVEKVLESKQKEVVEVTEQLFMLIEWKQVYLTDILGKVLKLTHDFNIENELTTESTDSVKLIYKKITCALDKLSNVSATKSQIIECECKNKDIKNILEQSKNDIAELTEKNLLLVQEFTVIEHKYKDILSQTQDVAILTKNLSGTNDLLVDLKCELKAKANELLLMEQKAIEWKNEFTDMQATMQQKISELEVENGLLRGQSSSCLSKTTPLSLSTICCRIIIEKMQLDSKKLSVPSSKSSIENQFAMVQVNSCQHTKMTQTINEIANIETLDAIIEVQTCKCKDMTQKINELIENNLRLTETIQELESVNQVLLKKQDDIVQENACQHTEMTQTSVEALDAMIQVQTCECTDMTQKINELKEDNIRLAETIQELESADQALLEKQDAVVQANACQHTQITQTSAEVNNCQHTEMTQTNVEALGVMIQVQTCECKDMTQKINELMEDIIRLAETNQELESANQALLEKQDAVVQANACQNTEMTQTVNEGASIEVLDAKIQVQTCECTVMTQKINELMKDNIRLVETNQELESANQALLNEQEEIRAEIRLLVEPANELRKKIVNHRTNLSTLTATTYAENKLLNSQVKVLKHHHTRYINVCQRDIPSVKTQLLELMTILNNDESFVDRHNATLERYSLPYVLDNNQDETNNRNESTLDGDLLMLDANLTMASAESTLLGQSCLDMIDDDVVETSKSIVLYSQKEWLHNYDKKLLETVKELNEENSSFREHLETCPLNNKYNVHKLDSQSTEDTNSVSSSSNTGLNTAHDSKLHQDTNSNEYLEKLLNQIKNLEQNLENMRMQKEKIDKKYTDLTFETELLVKKLNLKEEEHEKIAKLTKDLKNKEQDLVNMQMQKEEIEKKFADLTLETELLVKKLNIKEEEHEKIDKLTKDLKNKEQDLDNMQMQKEEIEKKFADLTIETELLVKKLNIKEKEHENIAELTRDLERKEHDLEIMQMQKKEVEKKYTDLTMKTELLVKKLNITEKENENIAKLTKELERKTKLVNDLQNENDQLSTQIMENISEVDDLRKELDSLKELNSKRQQLEDLKKDTKNVQTDIEEKFTENVQTDVQGLECSPRTMNTELLKSMQSKVTDQLLKLNQSLCDSERKHDKSNTENLARLNKICSLQHEIHESKEDAKQIAETVSIAKNTLEQSDYSMSMDLDKSISEIDPTSLAKDNSKDSNITNDNKTSDNSYVVDKVECLKYYTEITGKENFSSDVKLLDILKSFYNNLVSKHSEEVENLVNKLKDLEDTKTQLHTQFNQLTEKCEELTKEILVKDNSIENFNQVLKNITADTELFNQELDNITDEDKSKKLALMFNDQVLRVLDREFQTSISNIFESLINSFVNKHQQQLEDTMKRYSAAQEQVAKVEAKFNEVNNLLLQMKAQLTEKETENNLLKAQKEKIREISNAVTLDIVKKESYLLEMIKSGYDHLVESNVMAITDVDLRLPLEASINLLFQKIKDLSTHSDSKLLTEKESLAAEIIVLKNTLKLNEQKLATLETTVLVKEEELSGQRSENKDIKKNLDETILQYKLAQTTSQEKIEDLKSTILEKDQAISLLENKMNQNASGDANNVEFVKKLEELIKENEDLKSVNNIINVEKQQADLELQKSCEVINQKKLELDKLTSDILDLKDTVNANVAVIKTMTSEAKTLHEHNELLKGKVEESVQECALLKKNIKTHEKTAEIQTKMIHRLQKQKEEYEKSIKERDERLEELTGKCLDLQNECEAFKGEIDQLKNVKSDLENRVVQLETELEDNQKRRSPDAIEDSSRRRRKSLQDSNRQFGDDRVEDDHAKMEALFESRGKPDDLFLDCESGNSNRSTPVRLSRGRDSIKHEHSDDEPHSRPSSVLATRKRRQSIHDQHRNVVPTPSPHDQPRILETELEASDSNKADSELHERLASCQQELDELKEKYRELDEECETCAQYLHERDAQCAQLIKEKRELEQQVSELNGRLLTLPNTSQGESKVKFSDASVNTHEDWANLHSVVVDRMSFDAEVDKNKKLTRSIEELRYKNHDLKTTLQKVMDKYNSGKDVRELEHTKSQLSACQEELAELKQRYQELDAECETCAEYLKERDEQCRKLREVKTALESKLQEYEANTSVAQSVKKKRQSVHDQRRAPAADCTDAATETSDELSSHHRDSQADSTDQAEVKQLRLVLDKVLMEKSVLEHKLMAFHPTMYVATGSAIVQSQQLTDVMKENQKLKRINARLVEICKKRGRGKSRESRSRDNRENEDPEQMTLG